MSWEAAVVAPQEWDSHTLLMRKKKISTDNFYFEVVVTVFLCKFHICS